MTMTIESSATPDGRKVCELVQKFYYGSNVYSVHVFESDDGCEYKETHRSAHTGKKKTAMTMYKDYCGKYLRQRRRY